MKSIVLYGLKSEKEAYVCSRYEILGCERMSVTDLLFTASDFADHYGVSMVFCFVWYLCCTMDWCYIVCDGFWINNIFPIFIVHY